MANDKSKVKAVILDEHQEARAVALEAMLFLHSSGVWDYEYLMTGLNNFTDHFREFLTAITEPGDRATLELVKYYFKTNPGEIEKYTESSEAFLELFVKMREKTQLQESPKKK
ncbi:MAG: hypothetical protein K9N34_03520 [Candidatus Marinimicrobia bacterium]|nr:hypothetical protein [Candidatus Neomarinimicrobiota bacterium]MCF7840622.1 hypothetical protein [Candidatus Neomarinimicrobiota bacterium]